MGLQSISTISSLVECFHGKTGVLSIQIDGLRLLFGFQTCFESEFNRIGALRLILVFNYTVLSE